MTHLIVIPDGVNERAIEILQGIDDISIDAPGKMSREETLKAIKGATGLIVRSATQVDAELLQHAPNLKYVVRAGVGTDNIDLETATKSGVVVMNTPDGNTISTAEHAFGMMLALSRHTAQAHLSMLDGRWDRKKFQGIELRGKTLGIVGFGRIGQAIAKRAHAFEMTVIAFDIADMRRPAAKLGVRLVDMDELYEISDFITLHPILNDHTRGMINKDTLAKMKDGVRLVNAARGGLIVDDDLADAVKSGKVAGAALDVYTVEPPIADNPLIGLPGVIHTPHLAASTSDAQITVAIDAAEQMIDAIQHGAFKNVVNSAVLTD